MCLLRAGNCAGDRGCGYRRFLSLVLGSLRVRHLGERSRLWRTEMPARNPRATSTRGAMRCPVRRLSHDRRGAKWRRGPRHASVPVSPRSVPDIAFSLYAAALTASWCAAEAGRRLWDACCPTPRYTAFLDRARRRVNDATRDTAIELLKTARPVLLERMPISVFARERPSSREQSADPASSPVIRRVRPGIRGVMATS